MRLVGEDPRARLFGLLLDGLAELGVFTEGLVTIAAESAAKSMPGEGSAPEDVIALLLSYLNVKHSIENLDPETWEVKVSAKTCGLCPGSPKPRPELCPLAGLISAKLSLSLGPRFYALRWDDGRLVRVDDDTCRLRVRKARREGSGSPDAMASTQNT